MNTLEVEGKSIDEAIENACREFKVPREKLNIEILSEGSSGLLGLVGTKKARIRASLMTFEVETEAAKETTETPPEKPGKGNGNGGYGGKGAGYPDGDSFSDGDGFPCDRRRNGRGH
jgi:hypothetical protein